MAVGVGFEPTQAVASTVLAKQPLYQSWVSHRIAQRNCTGPDNRSRFYGPWLISFRRRNELETVCRGARKWLMHHSQAYTRVFPRCHLFYTVAFGARYRNLFFVSGPGSALSARAFWHFNTAILAKMIFYHKLCRHPTNRKTKDKDEKEAKFHLPFFFEILLPGNRVELFCASALPTLGYRVWFPTPKRGKMKKEKEGTPKRKWMENGSFRYTLILSHLFVFVSKNFLRRWFIPNMNFSSMIGSSCVFSAFLTAFLAWRNRIFIATGTDAALLSFRLLFVFPPLLRRIFRHLYRPLFLCA